MSEEMFCHSACCLAHWELAWTGEAYDLRCEKCGKSIGPQVTVIGPPPRGCAGCDREGSVEVEEPAP